MKKKIFITLVAISIIITLAYAVYYLSNASTLESQSEIVTEAARIGDLKIAFSIDGKTSIERRDLKFTVNGKVSHIGVNEGQEVKKWQYLMALDTQDVKKNLEKDLKDYLITRNTFEQINQVTYPNGALTDTIKRALESTQYSLDKSVLDVEIQDIALRESYLYSPIDGVVASINIKDGETTNTQSSLAVLTIVKPGSLTFEAAAEDTEILKINKDQKVTIKLDSIPNMVFDAQTEYISDLADIDANDLATYKIRASILNTKNIRILDGMTGQIIFTTKEKSNVLMIPNTSVSREDNKSVVLTRTKSGEIVKKQISTGFTDGKNVEVTKGLEVGDEVVIP